MADPRPLDRLAREEPEAVRAVAERAGPELKQMLRGILDEAGANG